MLTGTTATTDSGTNTLLFDGSGQGMIEVSLGCSEYSFESLDGSVERLTAENLVASGKGGGPELPQRLLRIALPPDADLASVRLTILSTTEVTVPGAHDLAPAPLAYASASASAGDLRAPSAGRGDEFWEGDNSSTLESLEAVDRLVLADPNQNIVDGRDVDVYSTDAFLDSEYATLIDTQQMGRWKIAEVAYSPFSYNPVTDEVRAIEAGRLELTFETDSPISAALMALSQWDDNVAQIVDNFQQAVDWYGQDPGLARSGLLAVGAAGGPKANSADFVIITTSQIMAGSSVLDDYVAMKERLGWSVYVATEADWGGGAGDVASENIRAWLRANYAALGIEYVMLVGNPAPGVGDVPMKMTYPQGGPSGDDYTVPTDYYYADLTSNWNIDGDAYYGEWNADIKSKPIHEVLVGRIPVYDGDYATLDSILNKTMSYQSEDDTDWRRNLLLPTAVVVYAREIGPITVDGVEVVDALAPVAQASGFDTFTLYEKEGILPTLAPSDLPLTHDNLVEHWASSPAGLVTWSAHGSSQGSVRKIWMADTDADGVPDANELSYPVLFSSQDAAVLDNTHPAVVFEGSCLNAYPEDAGNLAYSLLTNGAVGTFAATRIEYFQYVPRWYPTYDSAGFSQSYEYRVTGRLMQNPRTETLAASLQWTLENLGVLSAAPSMGWQNCVTFNLYGDPTVTLLNPASNPGLISGTVWDDVNGNGILEVDETGVVPGVTVFLDANGNGALDAGEHYTTSDSHGRYVIGGLPDGQYSVSLGLSAEYARSRVPPRTAEVSGGVDVTGTNFSVFHPGNILGSVVLDLNGTGIRESGEPGLAGVAVLLDAELDAYDATALTDADGYYTFTGLPAGNYTISQAVPTGYEPIGSAQHGVVLPDSGTVNVDLPDRLLPEVSGTLSGYCWYDIDASGNWETASEPGLNGRTLFLDLNGDGQLETGEPRTLSNFDGEGHPGYFQFSSLQPGRYVVRAVPLEGWTSTAPASGAYAVDLIAGSGRTGLVFGSSLDFPASILVSTAEDVDDGDLSFGDLSLREALRMAEERAGPDSIRFAPSLTGRTIQIDPALGTFVLQSDVEVVGLEDLPQTADVDERITLDGHDACTVIAVRGNATASLASLIVARGNATERIDTGTVGGGGVFVASAAALTLQGMKISGNRAVQWGGGIGVDTSGRLRVTNSEVSDNSADFGGGIYAYNKVIVAIEATTISDNLATQGGGIFVRHDGSTFSILNSLITDNSAARGAGIQLRGVPGSDEAGTSTIDNCTITDNSGIFYGGGVYAALTGAGIVVKNSTISGNQALGDGAPGLGGGVAAYAGRITLIDTAITGNRADYVGGGVASLWKSEAGEGVDPVLDPAEITLIRCSVTGNSAEQGGGVNLRLSSTAPAGASRPSVTILDSTIANNHVSGQGGAISAWDARSLEIVNTLIVSNTSEQNSPGLFLHNVPLTMTNSTIVKNTSPSISYGAGIHLDGATATLCNTIVTGHGIAPDLMGTLSSSSRNNLILMPVAFVDPASGDYRLQPSSPGIDEGDTTALPADRYDLDDDGDTAERIPWDLDGAIRVQGVAVDIGAYEQGNTPPTLEVLSGQTIGEGSLLQITAVGRDVDVPAQTLTYSLVAAPQGVSIGTSSGLILWQTGELDGSPTPYGFTVRVSDGIRAAERSFLVTVNETNVPPTLDPLASRFLHEGDLLQVTAVGHDADIPVQTLQYSLVAAPDGAAITPQSGVITWQTDGSDGNETPYNFTVRVSDGGAHAERSFLVMVYQTNTRPTLDPIPAQFLAEGDLLEITAVGHDADIPAQTLTYRITAGPQGASIDPQAGDIRWQTDEEDDSLTPYGFTVEISDGDMTAQRVFNVLVNEVNQAPVLAAIGNQSVDEGSLLAFTATATDADLPANTLTFSLTGDVPEGATISADGHFAWTPTDAQGPGNYTFTIEVRDGLLFYAGGLSDWEEISVEVREVNQAPVLREIGNRSVDEGSLLAFTVTATDMDLPANTLIFSLTGDIPAGATISADGQFSWTPTEAQGSSSYEMTIAVSDGTVGDLEVVTITVEEVNVPPVLAAIGAPVVVRGQLLTFTATATDPDDPANALTFSLDAASAGLGMTINPATGAFRWTPRATQEAGDCDVTVTVTDSGSPALSDAETFTIVVIGTWQNPRHPCDVNDDGLITAIDVLVLISEINTNGSRDLLVASLPTPNPPPFLDPSGDGGLSPIDVLIVINSINTYGSESVSPLAGGEGEPGGPIDRQRREATMPTGAMEPSAGLDSGTDSVVMSTWPPRGPSTVWPTTLPLTVPRITQLRPVPGNLPGYGFETSELEEAISGFADEVAQAWFR